MSSHINVEDAIKLCLDPKDDSILYYTHLTSKEKFFPNQEQTMDVICFLQRCHHILEISPNINLFKTEKVTQLIGLMTEEKRENVFKAMDCGSVKESIDYLEEKHNSL